MLTDAETRVLNAARAFQPMLKTFRYWELAKDSAFMADLADYDDEMPEELKNTSRELYEAVEELWYLNDLKLSNT